MCELFLLDVGWEMVGFAGKNVARLKWLLTAARVSGTTTTATPKRHEQMCWDSRAADSTARACRRKTLLALMKEKLLNKLTFFFGVGGSVGGGLGVTLVTLFRTPLGRTCT